MRLGLKSFAKINFTLEVLYRRDDGFHELKTILQELEYHDTLYFEELPEGKIEFSCSDRALPQGKDNLALQAALLLQSRYAPQKGARIHLVKRIPIAAGLGGGSSNAAAALKGLNHLWNLSLPKNILKELGAGLGSDVPFFIYGETALAEGRGEQIKTLPSFPPAKVLLILPRGKALSASKVYHALDMDIVPKRTNTDNFVALLQKTRGLNSCKSSLKEFCDLFCNDLEETVFALEEDVLGIKKRLLDKGLAALVSGSGPTVFALSHSENFLRDVGKELLAEGHRVILTETVSPEKYIIEEKHKDGDA